MIEDKNSNQQENTHGESKEAIQDDHLRKMFIGALSSQTTEQDLRSYYGQWGDVVDAIVMLDPVNKRSRGFGFITYSHAFMVDKAQAARPHVVNDKIVDSKRALPRPELGSKTDGNNAVKKIFVGGLKDNHDEQSLAQYFSQFGKVVNVKVLADKVTGRRRGFAFVEFDDYDSVDKVVLQKQHIINYAPVDVKKSVYKQEVAKKMMNFAANVQSQTPINGIAFAPQPNGFYAQAPYGYSNPSSGTYGNWGRSNAADYHQAPMSAQIDNYSGPPQGNVNPWNSNNFATVPNWNGNPYTTNTGISGPSLNGASPQTSWSQVQPFGNYQQTYNGGPQKPNLLQGNRVNPYNVTTPANYGANSQGNPLNQYIPPECENVNLSKSCVEVRAPSAVGSPDSLASKKIRRVY